MKDIKSKSRRKFVKNSATILIGAPVILSPFGAMGKKVTGHEIEKHFRKVGNWVNWKQTAVCLKTGLRCNYLGCSWFVFALVKFFGINPYFFQYLFYLV